MQYTRITKTQVITRLLDGQEVTICPSNLRLNTPWQCEATIDFYDIIDNPVWMGFNTRRENRSTVTKLFNRFLNHYKYYNCNDETGKDALYYAVQ